MAPIDRRGDRASSPENTAEASKYRLLTYLPGAAALAAWLFWIGADGGYFPKDYLPVGLLATALLAAVLLSGSAAIPPRDGGGVLLALLGVAGALSFLSILWADSPAAAFDASVKLLVLLAVSGLVAVTPWNARTAGVMLGCWVVGAAVVCGVALALAATSDSVADVIRFGRYADPIGYTNGVAALGVMAFIPAAGLASRREVPVAAQGALLAAACFLVELALLTQSRAAVLALAIGVVVLVVVSPGRIALLARLAALGLIVALAIDPVLQVYETATAGGHAMDALRDAARAMALTTAAAGLVGAVLPLAQRAIEKRLRLPRPDRRLVVGAVVAGLALAVGLAAAMSGRVEASLDDANESEIGDNGARIGSLDPEERLDYWRVAIDMFEGAPVLGQGAGNFEYHYGRERHLAKPSRYVHDVFLRAFGEGGLVGILIFAGIMIAAFLAMLRAWRSLAPYGAAVVAGCFTVAVTFLVHGSLDWMDEVPALATPALGFVLIASRLAGEEAEEVARPSPRLVAGTLAVTAFAVLAIGTSWLSVLYLDRASDRLGGDTAGAFDDIARAESLQPWSARPLLIEGVSAIEVEDPGRAREAFADSLDREKTAFAHLELGLLAAEGGKRKAALAEIDRAARIEPEDLFTRYARRQVLAGKEIDPQTFNRRLLGIERQRFASPVN
jgi:hypothetical protein